MSTTALAPPAPPPGTGLRTLARRHPVALFYALVVTVTWLLWLPYVLSTDGLGVLDVTIPSLLGSPMLLGTLPGAYLGPLGSAFVVTALADGRPGLRAWKHRLLHWRIGWRWYVGVLVGVPLAVLATTLVLPGAWATLTTPGLVFVASYPLMLLLQVVTTAVAEEPGWRDFALPRLQRGYGALVGTTVLGLIWGLWHLPLYLTAWAGPDTAWWHPVLFVFTCVPLSMVMTWVFNRTGRGLPVVVLFHASINATASGLWFAMFPSLDPTVAPLLTFALASTLGGAVVLVATRGRLGFDPAIPDDPREAPRLPDEALRAAGPAR